jgi:hypothetical protein
MTSTDALIHDLSASLLPVRRRRPGLEALALAALGGAELALVLLFRMRPDLGQVILSPLMVWKIGSLALLAAASITLALRSFAPTAKLRHGLVLLPVLALLTLAAGAFVTGGADAGRPLAERLAPAHGLICVAAIVVLGLPMMALLAVLMRRAAPTRPAQSAWIAGLAASTAGALIFTACCPMNDPLYILVWYSAAIALLTIAARVLLPRRFRL